MSDNVMKKYVIEIDAKIDKAEETIDKLEKQMESFAKDKALAQLITSQIDSAKKSIADLKSFSEKSFKGLQQSINKLDTSKINKQFDNVTKQLDNSISKIEKQVELLSSVVNSSDATKLDQFVAKLSKPFADLTIAIEKATDALNNFNTIEIAPVVNKKGLQQTTANINTLKSAINSLKEVAKNNKVEIFSDMASDEKSILAIQSAIEQVIMSAEGLSDLDVTKILTDELGGSLKALKNYYKRLNAEFNYIVGNNGTPRGDYNTSGVKPIERNITVKYTLDKENSQDIDEIVKDITENIIPRINEKLDKNQAFAKIKISADSDQTKNKLKKIVNQAINELNSDEAFTKIEVDFGNIDSKITDLIGKIENKFKEADINANVNLGGSSTIDNIDILAKDSTLQEIKTILSSGLKVVHGDATNIGQTLTDVSTPASEERTKGFEDYTRGRRRGFIQKDLQDMAQHTSDNLRTIDALKTGSKDISTITKALKNSSLTMEEVLDQVEQTKYFSQGITLKDKEEKETQYSRYAGIFNKEQKPVELSEFQKELKDTVTEAKKQVEQVRLDTAKDFDAIRAGKYTIELVDKVFKTEEEANAELQKILHSKDYTKDELKQIKEANLSGGAVRAITFRNYQLGAGLQDTQYKIQFPEKKIDWKRIVKEQMEKSQGESAWLTKSGSFKQSALKANLGQTQQFQLEAQQLIEQDYEQFQKEQVEIDKQYQETSEKYRSASKKRTDFLNQLAQKHQSEISSIDEDIKILEDIGSSLEKSDNGENVGTTGHSNVTFKGKVVDYQEKLDELRTRREEILATYLPNNIVDEFLSAQKEYDSSIKKRSSHVYNETNITDALRRVINNRLNTLLSQVDESNSLTPEYEEYLKEAQKEATQVAVDSVLAPLTQIKDDFEQHEKSIKGEYKAASNKILGKTAEEQYHKFGSLLTEIPAEEIYRDYIRDQLQVLNPDAIDTIIKQLLDKTFQQATRTAGDSEDLITPYITGINDIRQAVSTLTDILQMSYKEQYEGLSEEQKLWENQKNIIQQIQEYKSKGQEVPENLKKELALSDALIKDQTKLSELYDRSAQIETELIAAQRTGDLNATKNATQALNQLNIEVGNLDRISVDDFIDQNLDDYLIKINDELHNIQESQKSLTKQARGVSNNIFGSTISRLTSNKSYDATVAEYTEKSSRLNRLRSRLKPTTVVDKKSGKEKVVNDFSALTPNEAQEYRNLTKQVANLRLAMVLYEKQQAAVGEATKQTSNALDEEAKKIAVVGKYGALYDVEGLKVRSKAQGINRVTQNTDNNPFKALTQEELLQQQKNWELLDKQISNKNIDASLEAQQEFVTMMINKTLDAYRKELDQIKGKIEAEESKGNEANRGYLRNLYDRGHDLASNIYYLGDDKHNISKVEYEKFKVETETQAKINQAQEQIVELGNQSEHLEQKVLKNLEQRLNEEFEYNKNVNKLSTLTSIRDKARQKLQSAVDLPEGQYKSEAVAKNLKIVEESEKRIKETESQIAKYEKAKSESIEQSVINDVKLLRISQEQLEIKKKERDANKIQIDQLRGSGRADTQEYNKLVNYGLGLNSEIDRLESTIIQIIKNLSNDADVTNNSLLEDYVNVQLDINNQQRRISRLSNEEAQSREARAHWEALLADQFEDSVKTAEQEKLLVRKNLLLANAEIEQRTNDIQEVESQVKTDKQITYKKAEILDKLQNDLGIASKEKREELFATGTWTKSGRGYKISEQEYQDFINPLLGERRKAITDAISSQKKQNEVVESTTTILEKLREEDKKQWLSRTNYRTPDQQKADARQKEWEKQNAYRYAGLNDYELKKVRQYNKWHGIVSNNPDVSDKAKRIYEKLSEAIQKFSNIIFDEKGYAISKVSKEEFASGGSKYITNKYLSDLLGISTGEVDEGTLATEKTLRAILDILSKHTGIKPTRQLRNNQNNTQEQSDYVKLLHSLGKELGVVNNKGFIKGKRGSKTYNNNYQKFADEAIERGYVVNNPTGKQKYHLDVTDKGREYINQHVEALKSDTEAVKQNTQVKRDNTQSSNEWSKELYTKVAKDIGASFTKKGGVISADREKVYAKMQKLGYIDADRKLTEAGLKAAGALEQTTQVIQSNTISFKDVTEAEKQLIETSVQQSIRAAQAEGIELSEEQKKELLQKTLENYIKINQSSEQQLEIDKQTTLTKQEVLDKLKSEANLTGKQAETLFSSANFTKSGRGYSITEDQYVNLLTQAKQSVEAEDKKQKAKKATQTQSQQSQVEEKKEGKVAEQTAQQVIEAEKKKQNAKKETAATISFGGKVDKTFENISKVNDKALSPYINDLFNNLQNSNIDKQLVGALANKIREVFNRLKNTINSDSGLTQLNTTKSNLNKVKEILSLDIFSSLNTKNAIKGIDNSIQQIEEIRSKLFLEVNSFEEYFKALSGSGNAHKAQAALASQSIQNAISSGNLLPSLPMGYGFIGNDVKSFSDLSREQQEYFRVCDVELQKLGYRIQEYIFNPLQNTMSAKVIPLENISQEVQQAEVEVDNLRNKILELLNSDNFNTRALNDLLGITKQKDISFMTSKFVEVAFSSATNEQKADYLYDAYKFLGIKSDQAIADGITENASVIKGATQQAVQQGVVDTSKEVLDEHSPSKTAEQIGLYYDQGLGNGIKKGIPGIVSAIKEALQAGVIKQEDVDELFKYLNGKRSVKDTIFGTIQTNKDIKEKADLSYKNLYNGLTQYNEALLQTKQNTDALAESNEKLNQSSKQKYSAREKYAIAFDPSIATEKQLKGALGKYEDAQTLKRTTEISAWEPKIEAIQQRLSQIDTERKQHLEEQKQALLEIIKFEEGQNSSLQHANDIAEELGLHLDDIKNVSVKNNGLNNIWSFQSKGQQYSVKEYFDENDNLQYQIASVKELDNEYTKLQNTIKGLSGVLKRNSFINDYQSNMFGNLAPQVQRAQNLLKELGEIQSTGQTSLTIKEINERLEELESISRRIKGKNGFTGLLAHFEDKDLVGGAERFKEILSQLAIQYANGEIQSYNFSDGNTKLTYSVKTADKQLEKYVITLQATGDAMQQMVNSTEYIGPLGKLVGSFGKKFGELIRYTTASLSFWRVINMIKSGVNVVKELDTAMTEMQKVSNDTQEALDRFAASSHKMAQEIGSTAAVIQNSAADWLRLGYNIEEAADLSKNTAILMNVSEFESIDAATESMVAMVQAFKDANKDVGELSLDIIDKLNNIGNNFSISTSDLAKSLQRSSGALIAAGNDLDEAIALTTAANAIIQDPESTGSALKVISMRLRGTSIKELEEAGEDTEGVIETVSKLEAKIKELTAINGQLGISILDANGNYRDTYEILQDIADIWEEIGEADKRDGQNRQAALLEAMAGKTRSQSLASLLQNPDMLRKVYEASKVSEGSAQKENEKYLDSIEAHVQILTAKWQEFWNSALNRKQINAVLDLAGKLLDVATKLGSIPTAGILLGGGISLKHFADKMLGQNSLGTKTSGRNKKPFLIIAGCYSSLSWDTSLNIA